MKRFELKERIDMDDLMLQKYPKTIRKPKEYKSMIHAPNPYIPKCMNIHYENLSSNKALTVNRGKLLRNIFLKMQEPAAQTKIYGTKVVLSKKKIAEMIRIVDAQENNKNKSPRDDIVSGEIKRFDKEVEPKVEEDKNHQTDKFLSDDKSEEEKNEKYAIIEQLVRHQREKLYGPTLIHRERVIDHFGKNSSIEKGKNARLPFGHLSEQIEKRDFKKMKETSLRLLEKEIFKDINLYDELKEDYERKVSLDADLKKNVKKAFANYTPEIANTLFRPSKSVIIEGAVRTTNFHKAIQDALDNDQPIEKRAKVTIKAAKQKPAHKRGVSYDSGVGSNKSTVFPSINNSRMITSFVQPGAVSDEVIISSREFFKDIMKNKIDDCLEELDLEQKENKKLCKKAKRSCLRILRKFGQIKREFDRKLDIDEIKQFKKSDFAIFK